MAIGRSRFTIDCCKVLELSVAFSDDKARSGRSICRATRDDIDALLDICLASFPESLRWQSPESLGRKWWDATLASSSSESWVYL